MNRQDTICHQGDNAMMARWLASGGGVEALAGGRDAAVDDGLQAGRITTHPFSCADDGLRAGYFTTNPYACADDGLRCSQITRGYGCIPPA